MAEAVFEGAVGWFAGGFEDAAVDVHEPAVVAAAYAPLRHQAELQRRATVGAVHLDNADAAAEVAEGHQFLVHDFEREGKVGEVFGGAYGLPEAAQVLAARRPRPNVGHFGVFFGYVAVKVGAKGGVEEGGSRGHGKHLPMWGPDSRGAFRVRFGY